MKKIFLLILICSPVFVRAQSAQDYIYPYLQVALKNNPAIKASAYELEALTKLEAQTSALPDPDFTINWFSSLMQSTNFNQSFRLSYMQAFPWFRQLKTQKNVALLNTEKARLNYLYTTQNLFLEIYRNYYDLYFREKQLQWLSKNFDLLNQRKEWLKASYTAGKSSLVSTILLDMLLLNLENQIQIKEEEKKSVHYNFLQLLGSDSLEVVLPENLILPEIIVPRDSLWDTILQYNLRLQLAAANVQLYEFLTILERKKYSPTFSVGLEYNISTNASEIGLPMPMVSVKIPVRRKLYQQKIEAKNFEYLASAQKLESEKLQLTRTFETLWTQYQTEKQKLATNTKLLQLNQQAIELIQSNVFSSEANFIDWVNLQEKAIQLELEQLTQENDILMILAEIQFLMSL